MADCERALGRLDRALDLIKSPEAANADRQTKLELRIVESGVRRDQGLLDAAIVALQGPELTEDRIRPEYTRLYYAYADALLQAGREDEAREWFGRAARADANDETDAAERYEELDEFGFDDLDEDGEPSADGELGADGKLDRGGLDLVEDQELDEADDDLDGETDVALPTDRQRGDDKEN